MKMAFVVVCLMVVEAALVLFVALGPHLSSVVVDIATACVLALLGACLVIRKAHP